MRLRDDWSRMSRAAHVRFWESGRVKIPSATHLFLVSPHLRQIQESDHRWIPHRRVVSGKRERPGLRIDSKDGEVVGEDPDLSEVEGAAFLKLTLSNRSLGPRLSEGRNDKSDEYKILPPDSRGRKPRLWLCPRVWQFSYPGGLPRSVALQLDDVTV